MAQDDLPTAQPATAGRTHRAWPTLWLNLDVEVILFQRTVEGRDVLGAQRQQLRLQLGKLLLEQVVDGDLLSGRTQIGAIAAAADAAVEGIVELDQAAVEPNRIAKRVFPHSRQVHVDQ